MSSAPAAPSSDFSASSFVQRKNHENYNYPRHRPCISNNKIFLIIKEVCHLKRVHGGRLRPEETLSISQVPSEHLTTLF